MDETSPQTTANTQRLWSFTKSVIEKNTTKIRANTSGLYALNGRSQIALNENSKQQIQVANPKGDIVVSLDNSKAMFRELPRMASIP